MSHYSVPTVHQSQTSFKARLIGCNESAMMQSIVSPYTARWDIPQWMLFDQTLKYQIPANMMRVFTSIHILSIFTSVDLHCMWITKWICRLFSGTSQLSPMTGCTSCIFMPPPPKVMLEASCFRVVRPSVPLSRYRDISRTTWDINFKLDYSMYHHRKTIWKDFVVR